MITAVPPKLTCIPNSLESTTGRVDSTANADPPTNTILDTTLFKCSEVGLPGLIPGINPPFC